METAKNAAESLKETAANVMASAKSGMEKTKATAQEKGERMSAHDPVEKKMATQKKEERIKQVEFEKQQAMQYNALARGTNTNTNTNTAQSTGMSSAMNGHGIYNPGGPVMGGTIPTHPAGMNTETTGTAPAGHNTDMGDDMYSIP